MKQHTLKDICTFEGKGLHTGKYSHMRVLPAPCDTGIVFKRTDALKEIPALASNVSSTDRSTTISVDGCRVATIEHLMSALTGMGVDNAFVELDGDEVPILDGSARCFALAFAKAGIVQQDALRTYVRIPGPIEIRDERTGSFLKMTPSEELSLDVTVDFNSRVLGVQNAKWSEVDDYCTEIAPCRTFCFFHELEKLSSMGLVKGGDVENAIVIVDNPVSREQVEDMAKLFGQPNLGVTPGGYLSNLVLNFPDECGRHKLLDLLGDIRLCGGFPKAHIEAFKPGHGLNTLLALKAENIKI